MALSTRELYLVLRARDEASRTLRGLSREILASGAAAEAAQFRALAAEQRRIAERQKEQGLDEKVIQATLRQARAYEAEAGAVANAARQQQHFVNTVGQTGLALQTMGVAMTATGALSLLFFKNSIDLAVEYQRQVAHTHTQIDGFSASLQELSKIGLKVANNIGVAFEEIQPELFDIFSSTNANLKQAEILLNAFAKASVAGQTSMQSATRATIAILNAFNIPLERVNDVLDIQFELVRKGVGTYQEFADHLGNIIPSATRAGQSFEMVAAMLAFMTRNGLSAAMAATSGARAFEAMSHPKTLERLDKMGVKTRDLKGNMLPLTDILTQLRDKIMKLPPTDRVRELVELFRGAGGTIQARRFLEQVLLRPGELEELKAMLASMSSATGVFETKYNEMADSVAVQSQLLKNRWTVLREELGEALIPLFLQLISVVSDLLKAYNELPDSTKRVVAITLALTAALVTLGGAFLVIVGGAALLGSAIAATGGTILAIVGAAAAFIGLLVGLALAFKMAYDRSEQFRRVIDGVAVRTAAFFGMLGTVGRKMAEEWDKTLGPAMRMLGRTLDQHVLPAFADLQEMINEHLIPAVNQAGRLIGDYFAKVMSIFANMIENLIVPALRELAEWWGSVRERIEPFLPILAQVVKWMLIIGAVIAGSLVAIIAGVLIVAVMALVSIFIVLIEVFVRIMQVIRAVIGWFKDLWGWIQNLQVKIRDLSTSAIGAFNSLKTTIINAVSNFGSMLVNAGEDLIRGLIRGINNMFSALKSTLGKVGSFIKDNKGPREYDLRLLRPAGQDIMAGLMRGINDEFPALLAQLQGVNQALTFDASANGRVDSFASRPLGPPAERTVTNNFHQTINVTTQEIDPRTQSAQLGWELSQVMS